MLHATRARWVVKSLRGLSHDRVREGPLRVRTNGTQVELNSGVEVSRKTITHSEIRGWLAGDKEEREQSEDLG